MLLFYVLLSAFLGAVSVSQALMFWITKDNTDLILAMLSLGWAYRAFKEGVK